MHSTQVGEDVRTGYRGQTLNFKGGYNICELSRQVLEEKRDEKIEEQSSNGLEENYCEPRGLRRWEGEKTGEKRKNFQ